MQRFIASLFLFATFSSSQVAAAQQPVLVADLMGNKISDHEELMFVCLQGLANRDQPRVFLHLQRADRTWLKWYEDEYGITTQTLDSPYELLATGDWPIAGYVLIDPKVPHTMNLAATYCSTENLLPVTEAILEHPRMPELEVKRDLRGEFRGMTPEEIYRWSYEHQFADAAKNVLCSLDVPGPGVRPIVSYHHIRDYAIARHGLFLGLSSQAVEHPQEKQLKDRFLQQLDRFAFIMGWHMERDREPDHVRQATKHNTLVFCSTESSNFSFHRYMDNRRPLEQTQRPDPAEMTVEPKIYISFIYSDGDSLNHFSRGHGYQYFLDRRGEVPVGWEIQPMLTELAPGMLEYFYAHATTNDSFVASASAIGYEYPEHMSKDDLRTLLRASVPYFEAVDTTALVVLYDPKGPNVQIDLAFRSIYDEELGGAIDSIFEGYWETKGEASIEDNLVWLVTKMPFLMMKGSETKQMIRRLKDLADRNEERPLFVPIHVPKGHMDYNDLLEIQSALDDRFKIVLPEVLAEAYRREQTSEGIHN